MMNTMRCVRVLSGETVESVAAAIGVRKASVSSAERFPERVSKPLQNRLAAFYGTSWRVLSGTTDSQAIAKSILSRALA